ncbi:MAG: NAD-dependent deacylase [Aquificaceae bacterium]|nr:NAD-dependent deacylase [Aquificaceae bacterium]MCX8060007.1 NAD-dependent deacylase [Aquificaceae bacterium]MDW8097754.1 NAD-dependent deacylase [Aquificaceae bacterium]
MRVAVLTGAGISAESGIPTFRDEGGLWKNLDPKVLATPTAFERNPALVWEWYLQRRSIIAKAKPNAGHLGLVELEQELGENFFLITQNVDGLHQRAGSRRLVELHGNIWKVKCLSCDASYEDYSTESAQLPPRCRECGGLIRPAVVWFGEPLPADALETAYRWAQNCDLFVCIGTSGEVYPAAHLPYVAKEAGAQVVEINPKETKLSPLADLCIREPATKGVQELLKMI